MVLYEAVHPVHLVLVLVLAPSAPPLSSPASAPSPSPQAFPYHHSASASSPKPHASHLHSPSCPFVLVLVLVLAPSALPSSCLPLKPQASRLHSPPSATWHSAAPLPIPQHFRFQAFTPKRAPRPDRSCGTFRRNSRFFCPPRAVLPTSARHATHYCITCYHRRPSTKMPFGTSQKLSYCHRTVIIPCSFTLGLSEKSGLPVCLQVVDPIKAQTTNARIGRCAHPSPRGNTCLHGA